LNGNGGLSPFLSLQFLSCAYELHGLIKGLQGQLHELHDDVDVTTVPGNYPIAARAPVVALAM
jgi:hypothetical protein